MTKPSEEEYRERMRRRKAQMDERIVEANEEHGVLLVLTGPGKGKSSSAFGMVARAAGYGMQSGIVYFIKSRVTGEQLLLLGNASYRLVVLDELCIAFCKEMLPLEPVLAALRARPSQQHVVITGRGAPEALIELADTVSDVRVIKHAFQSGIKAQRGIEL